MAGKAPYSEIDFLPARVEVEERAGGEWLLRSPEPLGTYETHVGEMLRAGAGRHADRAYLCERLGDGWRKVTWGEALAAAQAIGQGLLERGLGSDKPLMVLSPNSIDQGLLMLGCFLSGVAIAPVSPAYSLMSKDYSKVHHIVSLVQPAAIYVDALAPFQGVLESLDLTGIQLITKGDPIAGLVAEPFSNLLDPSPGPALAAAEAALSGNSVAKYLFTSGSTGLPKGVINTHRMLCSNQTMVAQIWPFLRPTPPVLVDWLPWNHTFAGNHDFNLVLKQGGTYYIDAGKPAPGLIEQTVRNLSQVSPTIYLNVPAGFAQLLPHLEADAALRRSFFAELQLIMYAGAALPADLWQRLEDLAIAETGRRVVMTSSWGATETAPLATSAHFLLEKAGVIGLPAPGVEIKLVPAGSKMEVRVRGPNVTPGYLGAADLTAAAFDAEGFYRSGDAARFEAAGEPARGLVFDGRVAEDFKLLTGVWVSVGQLRIHALAAAAPVLQDAVVAGEDRAALGLLAWLNPAACKALIGDEGVDLTLDQLNRHGSVIARLRAGLEAHNADNPASSTRISRVLLMATPADIDANEITDKGYINQRAVLDRRGHEIARLYAEPADDAVIVIE